MYACRNNPIESATMDQRTYSCAYYRRESLAEVVPRGGWLVRGGGRIGGGWRAGRCTRTMTILQGCRGRCTGTGIRPDCAATPECGHWWQ